MRDEHRDLMHLMRPENDYEPRCPKCNRGVYYAPLTGDWACVDESCRYSSEEMYKFPPTLNGRRITDAEDRELNGGGDA